MFVAHQRLLAFTGVSDGIIAAGWRAFTISANPPGAKTEKIETVSTVSIFPQALSPKRAPYGQANGPNGVAGAVSALMLG